MKRIIGLFIGLAVLFNILSVPASAWWIILDEIHGHNTGTHEFITKAALQSSELVGLCPDLSKFAAKLKTGSNKESHNTAKDATDNNNALNGGYPKAWWDEGKDDKGNPENAMFYYNSSNFTKAYIYIGRVIHLVQDMGVPAHPANIRHGGLNLDQDNFESAADLHRDYDLSSPLGAWGYPDQFYQKVQDDTRSKLSVWVEPVGDHRQYWRLSPNAPLPGNDTTAYPADDETHRGSYGGDNGKDIYNYNIDLENETVENPAIQRAQLTRTLGYTEGALIAASKSLPPLINNIEITQTPVNTPQGVKIRFDVMENRLQDVKVALYVQETGQRIITQDLTTTLDSVQCDPADPARCSGEFPGRHLWADKAVALHKTNPSNLSLLPYVAAFQTEWHGRVAGNPPLPGSNQYGPPLSAEITGTASTIETAPWFTGDSLHIRVSDGTTGVSTFSVTRVLPGGAGEAPQFSLGEENGRYILFDKDITLPDAVPGYKAVALDVAGNATVAFFHLDRTPPDINVSTIVINKVPGGYTLGVSGTASDVSAGLAGAVTRGFRDTGTGEFLPARPGPVSWPPGPAAAAFDFTYPYAGTEYDAAFYVYDTAGLLGVTDMFTWRANL